MQPPPPPPVVSMTGTATCQWCSRPMNSTDVRCPSCSKLRKDIYTDKVKSYIFCIAGGLLIGVSIAMMKKSKPNDFEYYYNNTSSGNNTLNYVLLGLGIACALAGIFFYGKVSQKLKTWWWT